MYRFGLYKVSPRIGKFGLCLAGVGVARYPRRLQFVHQRVLDVRCDRSGREPVSLDCECVIDRKLEVSDHVCSKLERVKVGRAFGVIVVGRVIDVEVLCAV